MIPEVKALSKEASAIAVETERAYFANGHGHDPLVDKRYGTIEDQMGTEAFTAAEEAKGEAVLWIGHCCGRFEMSIEEAKKFREALDRAIKSAETPHGWGTYGGAAAF